MRHATPKPILLEDYKPPGYLVDSIDLLFDLGEEFTQVTSTLSIRANPEAEPMSEMLLDGEDLELLSLRLNGIPLTDGYVTGPGFLKIDGMPPGRFVLEIVTLIHPSANTALEGLYLSSGLFCTQCEAQGFRKITYFPDRPDVMSVFTTTLIAPKNNYPVLLSNGNLQSSGDLLDGRHFARWHDPFPKPCYLFALVAGQLDCLEDRYQTGSGREIRLQIFSEPQDIGKCGYALESLKHAMRWDEAQFGREYDLDLYMIVAVSHFNMGAMENKGLNIFNTKFVLASPDTATDSDYEHIEGVIGHEYFHNWTGNRITLRDWFQLSLKEGLTVFRDQEFSADRHSRAVKRIDEVNLLRNRQFLEDAGPLAHPVRPSSYIEINNFYTLTVYEKGAEIVRMIRTLLGHQGFRKGMDLYFDRLDGRAVTCEDFLRCMEDANQVSLGDFSRWYQQSGTPKVRVEELYDHKTATLTLRMMQSCDKTIDQDEKLPLVIPIEIGLVGPEGEELPVRTADSKALSPYPSGVLTLSDASAEFHLIGVPPDTTVSVLRNFSAPVRLEQPRSPKKLAFQFENDPDPFNRWDAGQILVMDAIKAIYSDDAKEDLRSLIIAAYQKLLAMNIEDHSYLALLLQLPDVDYIGSFIGSYDPVRLTEARESLKMEISSAMADLWAQHYVAHHREDYSRFDAKAIGERRFKNTCLDYLGALAPEPSDSYALRQFQDSSTMTDRLAALTLLVNRDHPEREACLHDFYEQWKNEDLVLCKWFSLQAASPSYGTLERIKSLMAHPRFDLRTPNHVRSLLGAFSQTNPVNFHRADGLGYEFMADCVIELNPVNPQIAARTLTSLTTWRRYNESRQNLMRSALEKVARAPELSPDVFEVASKALA